MFNKNEFYKLSVYLTCTHLDLKLNSFMGKYFTLSDKSMCKCFILKTDDNLVNIKYRTLFGPCGLNANGCKYYIFIKPFYNHSTFLNEFEFLLVDTTGRYYKAYR